MKHGAGEQDLERRCNHVTIYKSKREEEKLERLIIDDTWRIITLFMQVHGKLHTYLGTDMIQWRHVHVNMLSM